MTWRLGYAKTFELFVSPRTLEPREAERLGLVNEVVPALRLTKPLVRAAADMSWHYTLALEEYSEPRCFTTRPHRDAVLSMLRR